MSSQSFFYGVSRGLQFFLPVGFEEYFAPPHFSGSFCSEIHLDCFFFPLWCLFLEGGSRPGRWFYSIRRVEGERGGGQKNMVHATHARSFTYSLLLLNSRKGGGQTDRWVQVDKNGINQPTGQTDRQMLDQRETINADLVRSRWTGLPHITYIHNPRPRP